MKLTDLNILDIGNTIQIAGVVFADAEKNYLCFLPGEKSAQLPVHVLDLDSDEWKAVIRQTDLLETEVLARAADGTLAKVILRKSQRQIDAVLSWKVFKRDGYRCRYCGRDDTPLTVDHLVLWEEGGPTIEENLVSACKKCNKVRGNLQYAEWLKHPRYLDVSSALDEKTRQANADLVGTLAAIERSHSKRTR